MPSLTGLLAMLLAALSAALLVTSPAGGVDRATRAADRSGVSGWTSVLRVFIGRPDATPLSRRLCVSLVAAVALGVALQSVGGGVGAAGWVLAPLVVPLTVLVLGRLEPVATRRRRLLLMAELPQALELLSACLAAGMPLRSATTAVADSFQGPIAEDLGRVLALVNLGTSDVEAWAALRETPEWRSTVDLARSVESGTMMVDVLLQHAQDARNQRRAGIEVSAKAVGVRSVLPLMTCFLPAFLLLGVIPTVASALLHAFH